MAHGNLPQTQNADLIPTDDSYGFFLFFFDEISGHIPLFTYPSELIDNENEKEIISIHSIWWHQDKFLETEKFITMDLELGGVTYCATLILCQTRRVKRRSGMDSSKWQAERFVLFVKAPSSVSFIAQEILYELKTRIQGNIGENLCFLVESHLKGKEDSEIAEFLRQKSEKIEYQLIELCNLLIPKIPITKLETQLEMSIQEETVEPEVLQSQELEEQVIPKKHKQLRFSIPKGKKLKVIKDKPEAARVPGPKRVKILQINRSKDDTIVRVTVCNNSSKPIINGLLKIYESQGFFGKDILVTKIDKWEPTKEITIEFEPTKDIGNIYFLKVEDENETIKVRRILG
ncbi:MAG: hypothetical protein JSV04_07000 [Candidatus Heimdallarchaeota archaeon]|nr:MAG: hypothetical protein JSV04_07000 [Candidatus Heimdallarchaeota archaeon]